MIDQAAKLRTWTVDWNGALMVDGEPPRDGLHCRDLRDAAAEIERLRELLRHADDVVIWEHTPVRSGFQEEIEDALGIGKSLDDEQAPHIGSGQDALDYAAGYGGAIDPKGDKQ